MNLEGIPRPPPTPAGIQRFWRKVQKKDGCWLWIGTTSNGGHGYIRHQKRGWGAHQFSWVIHHGPIPHGLVVMHVCDNPPCVNPDHLVVGTQRANCNDMWAKGRNKALRGEAQPNAKITEVQAREILALLATGVRHADIGARFGLHPRYISQIATGRKWKHLRRAEG